MEARGGQTNDDDDGQEEEEEGSGAGEKEGATSAGHGGVKQPSSAHASKKIQRAIKAARDPGPPKSWPADCDCEFRSCMVWGNPKSPSEQLRRR